MTKSHGYPVWSKFIDTADGYTLNIFRIPGPRGESLSQSIINSSNREPVLMLHGILSSSEGFIMNGPLIAPVYQIVDTGRYDAWLLNVRGNSYSKQHNFYNSKSDKQYWQFGFEEMANYDLTAAVDYVLRVTQKKQLTIIGFSQGTTITFASLAMNNEFYKDKVKAFIALAPVITMKNATSSLLKQLSQNDMIPLLLETNNFYEMFPENDTTIQNTFDTLGQICIVLPSICTQTLSVFADTRADLVNQDRISLYFKRFSAGTSLKNLVHMGQIMTSGKFQQYDYGFIGNFAQYAASSPPQIDISSISIPVALFIGKYDTLATPVDNEMNKGKIKQLIHYKEYELDHLGFILAKDMTYFKEVISVLDQVNYGSLTTLNLDVNIKAPQGADPVIMMDDIVEMLKLLDYENKFCRQKGFKPLSRTFFALVSSNPSEQFMYFVQLVSYLLSINNHQVTGWNKYDDPMTASQNVILELKKLGIEVDMPPNKLKTGYGDGVCAVLLKLCSVSLQNKFKFKKFTIKDEAGGLDDEGEDVGDDMDGGADIADMANNQNDDDDIEDFADFGQGADHQDENLQNQIIQSSISREEWMMEVERVAHKLKISNLPNDGKEWRSHLDQTKKYADSVKQALPDVRTKLEKLSDEVSKALERIGKKEGILSKSFQGMTGDYRAHSENLKDIQTAFATVSKNVGDMENELSEINERLSNVERKIDDTGKSFSDNTPLQKIKKSIATVKSDIKSIDIRIGVVSNTLLQLKLKERTKQQEDTKSSISKMVLENNDDYDLEI
eukprot:403373853